MILRYPCHFPLSLKGMMSLSRTVTTVVMPPPPMPANARAAISSGMVRARPQKRHPMPKMVYALSRATLRPKMSLSLPYRGWKVVRVRKYLSNR